MKNVLLFGDSNFYGAVIDPKDAPYPGAPRYAWEDRVAGLVQKKLGNEFRVIEDALPGRMAMMSDPLTPDRRGYEQLRLALEMHAPVDWLVMQLGTNEVRPMFNMSAEMIACSVDRLVIMAKQHPNAPKHILLIAPHPMSPDMHKLMYGFLFGTDGYEKTLGFSKAFANVAQNQSIDFIDCAPMRFELNPIDGIHYSKADLIKLSEAIAAKIRNN